LRSKLVAIRAGNQLLRLMRLDFISIEARCHAMYGSETELHHVLTSLSTQPFTQLSDEDKVLAVCAQLIAGIRGQGSATQPNPFIPLDQEHVSNEEVTWILCLLSHHLPRSFNPLHYISHLLTRGNGARILVGLVYNHPDLLESVMEELLDFGGTGQERPKETGKVHTALSVGTF